MNRKSHSLLITWLWLLETPALPQQALQPPEGAPIRLQVETGTPLRLYLTQRVSYRMNEVVHAKFAEPVWAFDRVVIPVGSVVQGRVTKLDPVPKMARLRAIANGDFTPLKRAGVSFTSITCLDGKSLSLRTENSTGLATIYAPPRPSKPSKKPKKASHPSAVRRFLQQQAEGQINAQTRGIYGFVRGPNKREWLVNYLMSRLPYHPQWYRKGTRFDALLDQPIDFGNVTIAQRELEGLRTQPPPDSVAQMRMLSTISSSDARLGDEMEGTLSEPVFTADRKLVLPEGALLKGKITLANRARFFHRGGRLRFTLDDVELPKTLAAWGATASRPEERSQPVQGQLAAVEADPTALKVDSEGTAKATESKTRLLRPAIAALVAAKSMDNDTGKQTATGTGDPNTAGRTLGGFSGFGLLGMVASYGPHQIAPVLGFYGLGWSVYTTIVSRGNEVTFQKNSTLAIRFGTPPKPR
jgi:hypothetical protein